MDEKEWMNDPALEGIDKSKLDFLEKLVIKSSSMTQKEMLPFLLSLAKLSRENNISFDKNEIFGRSRVEEVTGLKNTRASLFLKELLERNIIQKVTGHGKGKYTFFIKE